MVNQRNSCLKIAKMSCFLCCLYNDPKTPGSFGGLDKAYRTWKNIIPSLTKKQVKDLAQSELAYTLHRAS